jgi:hypothetical protein
MFAELIKDFTQKRREKRIGIGGRKLSVFKRNSKKYRYLS